MKPSLSFTMRKRQFFGLLIFGIALFSLKVTFFLYQKQYPENYPEITFVAHPETQIILTEFNPNDLNAEQWQKLGFTEQQTATILKYKNVVGGTFVSKAQLKKCYAISEEKFNHISPYILLPELTNKEFHQNIDARKGLTISQKFNPDDYTKNDWVKMGFSENQAAAILKYKDYLGGSFVSKEKFKDCYIINDESYKKLSSFLILPEKTPESFKAFAKTPPKEQKIQYKNFDPNLLDLQAWIALGFSENQAKVIVNYRDKNLKGSFRNLEELKSCFVISEKKYNELKPYVIFNPDNFKNNSTEKPVITKQQTQTDFTTIDLNKITFKQLIEFGFDEKAAGSYIGFRRKLGGFVNTKQILDTYNIDKDLTQKLINTCKFTNDDVQKYTLVDAPEEWLKNHPYFKYSADKIIFYRLSNPDDQKIWKFLKLKPEYETKMRWYIK